ncbi:hypothetical protein FLT15_11580 [Paenibacillus thiaminolyticus]|uniref:hypothetical protein n=2 Tax=Paenibacillus thiaminolyticus TaxID=49283 RepID=UPI0011620257|nr:hypothetical protein [Paenibacillus thiaminolyticus]NGP58972.1 hypothetical protein [Paenibacillus thiaminolyticus]
MVQSPLPPRGSGKRQFRGMLRSQRGSPRRPRMMKQNLLRPMKELYDRDYERTASRFLQQAQICIMIVHIIR